jgi:hypothetical protein
MIWCKVLMKKIILTILFILPFLSVVQAQERYGICNSMFAGTNGIWINPASMVRSPFKWDVNIITIHTYADNTYLYLKQANIPSLIKDNGNTDIMVNNAASADKGTSSIMLFERDNKFRKGMNNSVLVQGPSFMISKNDWAVGFSMSVREAASLSGLNKTGADLFFQGLTYDPFHNVDLNIKRFRVNAMVWNEFGFSAGKVLKRTTTRLIKGGITYKFIRGLGDAYFINKKGHLYVPNDSDLYFNNISAKYGYDMIEGLNSQGTGHAFDIGITMEKKKNSKTYKCPSFCDNSLNLYYDWKIGASLMDIGFINFKKNAATYTLNNASSQWYNFNHTSIDNTQQMDTSVSVHFYNNPIPKPGKTKYISLMPMAMSLQYDYNIGYNIYINGTWVQRIPHFGAPGPDRANSIAITPRFDTRRFGLAVPVVLYSYLYPRVGLALRLNNNLVIGTDKLDAIIGHKLTGADIYFSLKVNALKNCKTKGKKKKHMSINRKQYINKDNGNAKRAKFIFGQ